MSQTIGQIAVDVFTFGIMAFVIYCIKKALTGLGKDNKDQYSIQDQEREP